MSLVKEILRTISNYPGGYGMIYKMIYDQDPSNKRPNVSSVQNTLSRLKKQKLISNKDSVWNITPLGKEILLKKNSAITLFAKEKPKLKQVKQTIVVFDIPEKKRKYRDWLRHELIGFGFEFIQQSVWFGPKLPKEFILYLDEQKLLPYVRFFKVKEDDLI